MKPVEEGRASGPGKFPRPSSTRLAETKGAPIITVAEQPRFLRIRWHKFLAMLAGRDHDQVFAAIKLSSWIQRNLVWPVAQAVIDVDIHLANAEDGGIGFQHNFRDR